MNCPDCSPTKAALDGYFVCNSEHYCIEDADNNFVHIVRDHDYPAEFPEFEVTPVKYCTCGWIDNSNGVG